jgi:DNA-directed RNA polymerase specialized sigma24 family protein
LLDAWYERGDRTAGNELIRALSAAVRLPGSFAAALSAEVAAELEHDALVRLLDRRQRALVGVSDPVAFAATVARNLARDALRRHRRRGDLRDDRDAVHDLQLPSTAPEPYERFDAARAVALLGSLGADARLAVLLVHAPERMTDDDWGEVCARQETTAETSPAPGALDREAASRLLWPPELPETQPARRRRLERLRKVLERAYAQLADALGAR